MSKEKVTKLQIKYPKNQEPDLIVPSDYQPYRFILGKKGNNPLVAVCMNPSAAREEFSDMTINTVIRTSEKLGYGGWIVVNMYPERATDVNNMESFDEKLHQENIEKIAELIDEFDVKQIWGAWGNLKHKNLVKAKSDLMKLLLEKNVKVFHFGKLLKSGNPHHPLYLKIDKTEMKEMVL